MREIWKDIEGYEGLYQVSSHGRVASYIQHPIRVKNGPKILCNIEDKDGYLRVSLCKYKKHKSFLVHRLVAKAFIPNPKRLPSINHRDENKKNNCVDNLEWCTHRYNTNYGNCIANISKSKIEKRLGHPVIQKTLEGVEIARFDSVYIAGKMLSISNSLIYRACKGKLRQAGGYLWELVSA